MKKLGSLMLCSVLGIGLLAENTYSCSKSGITIGVGATVSRNKYETEKNSLKTGGARAKSAKNIVAAIKNVNELGDALKKLNEWVAGGFVGVDGSAIKAGPQKTITVRLIPVTSGGVLNLNDITRKTISYNLVVHTYSKLPISLSIRSKAAFVDPTTGVLLPSNTNNELLQSIARSGGVVSSFMAFQDTNHGSHENFFGNYVFTSVDLATSSYNRQIFGDNDISYPLVPPTRGSSNPSSQESYYRLLGKNGDLKKNSYAQSPGEYGKNAFFIVTSTPIYVGSQVGEVIVRINDLAQVAEFQQGCKTIQYFCSHKSEVLNQAQNQAGASLFLRTIYPSGQVLGNGILGLIPTGWSSLKTTLNNLINAELGSIGKKTGVVNDELSYDTAKKWNFALDISLGYKFRFGDCVLWPQVFGNIPLGDKGTNIKILNEGSESNENKNETKNNEENSDDENAPKWVFKQKFSFGASLTFLYNVTRSFSIGGGLEYMRRRGTVNDEGVSDLMIINKESPAGKLLTAVGENVDEINKEAVDAGFGKDKEIKLTGNEFRPFIAFAGDFGRATLLMRGGMSFKNTMNSSGNMLKVKSNSFWFSVGVAFTF